MSDRGRRLLGELVGFAHGLARTPTLALDWRTLPRGDGPVLVLPGFATTDTSTVVIRSVLDRLGYASYGWGLGRNHGNHTTLLPRVVERIARLASDHGEPLLLVGWSLGGMFAREATRLAPERVRGIVTLGTPLVGGGEGGIPVPITAIYSKRDAVVPWHYCIDPDSQVEHVEVDATHFELGVSPEVLRIVAATLARYRA
jgi:alpha-beta hydrolase superfamily lysophospholipase